MKISMLGRPAGLQQKTSGLTFSSMKVLSQGLFPHEHMIQEQASPFLNNVLEICVCNNAT